MDRMTLNPQICDAMRELNDALESSTVHDGTITIDPAELLMRCSTVLTQMADPGFREVTQCVRTLAGILDGYDLNRQTAFLKTKEDYQVICRSFGVRPTLKPGA